MTRQLRSVAAILFSTLIFLVGNGLLGTVIPVRAHLAGFSDFAIGLIGSAYYVGFVAGCYAGPHMLSRAGHSRTFAAAAGLAAAATLMQALMVSEIAWILLRGFFGFAAAGLYMVIESWLNDRADNQTRGRIFAAYLVVNFAGLIVGQLLFVTGRPTSFSLFSLAAIFYSLCLIPVGLTRTPQPARADVPALDPFKLFRISPVGVAGCIAVGFANAAVWTFAPVYAEDHGMTRGLLAAFMATFTLGGALSQIPIGRFSDRMDRRWVIVGTTLLAACAGVALYLFGGGNQTLTFVLVAIFGTVTLPLYGLSVAHANDRLPREMFVEASATLLMINAVASMFGPVIAAVVTARAGTSSLFLYTAAIHVSICVFALARLMAKGEPPGHLREPYEAMPPQSSPTVLELDPRSPEHEKRPDVA
ncbi:MAG TPA: MFS transporter [Rhizomicrobium sp.]|nr:MFS transporter [Rhizomicrobium sp.]